MRTVALASLRAYARRYLAAGIAVAVSVGFVVVIGVLVSGALAGIMRTDGSPYRAADYVVEADRSVPHPSPACCPELMDPAVAIALVERFGDDASATGRVEMPARVDGGAAPGPGGVAGTTIGPLADAPDMRWQEIVSGRFPTGAGEAVMHVWDAQSGDVAVGDRIRVGDGAGAVDLTVVGLVESPSTWVQASLYVTWEQYLRWRAHPTFHVGDIAVRGDVGPLPAGTVATPALRHVTDSLTTLNRGTDAFALVGLVFTGAALLVCGLVVANTFAILLAQRRRELALLRCVGATRRQVTGSVRGEAAMLGTLASLVGVPAGVGLGYGVIAAVGAVAPGTPLDHPALPVPWLLGGVAVGLLVTMVASWLPARSTVRVAPLAALRPQAEPFDPRTGHGRARQAVAVLALAAGAALLAVAVLGHDRVAMVVGGGTLFVGVLLVGPRLIPALLRIAGAALGRGGRLPTANAVRNPRRTATTTAALMIGVTLTTSVLTGMATWRAAMDEHRDTRLPIDVTLASLDRPLPPGLLDRVRETPGVDAAIAVDGTLARLSAWDAPIPVIAAPDAARVARDGGTFASVPPGTIVLDHEAFRGPRTELRVPPGGRVTVRAGDREVELKVIRLAGWGRAGVVAPATLAMLTDAPEPRVVWARSADDANGLRVVGALDDLAGAAGAELSDRVQVRAAGDRQLDVLTWALLAFIGVSMAVAAVGIASTMGLSALERAREHALMRALGLTRGGLRRLLGTEALLLAVVATGVGAAIGVGYGWVACEAVVRPALGGATLVVPWPSLAAVVLGVLAVGLLAAVLPARRAARVTPAAGLSPD